MFPVQRGAFGFGLISESRVEIGPGSKSWEEVNSRRANASRIGAAALKPAISIVDTDGRVSRAEEFKESYY